MRDESIFLLYLELYRINPRILTIPTRLNATIAISMWSTAHNSNSRRIEHQINLLALRCGHFTHILHIAIQPNKVRVMLCKIPNPKPATSCQICWSTTNDSMGLVEFRLRLKHWKSLSRNSTRSINQTMSLSMLRLNKKPERKSLTLTIISKDYHSPDSPKKWRKTLPFYYIY